MKAKPPSPTPGRPQAPSPPQDKSGPARRNPRLLGGNRWQRVVRYGWDKGGAKGGRR